MGSDGSSSSGARAAENGDRRPADPINFVERDNQIDTSSFYKNKRGSRWAVGRARQKCNKDAEKCKERGFATEKEPPFAEINRNL